MTVYTAGPSGATVQENDNPAVDHRHVHKITLTLALQSDQAGPSRATIRESNPLMIEILKLSYVTNPPRLDQPAGPSVATIPENKKPAVENQLKPIYKISPPPVSLPVEDSQLGQPAGSSAATVYEKSKFFDGGTPTGRKLKGMEAIFIQNFEIQTSLFQLLGFITRASVTCVNDHRKSN